LVAMNARIDENRSPRRLPRHGADAAMLRRAGRACRQTTIPVEIRQSQAYLRRSKPDKRMQMPDDDLREQIARLECQIEERAEAVARCGRIAVVSKAAIAVGGILILAMTLGAIWFDPMTIIGAIAAVIGGTVLFGSNRRTAQDFAAAMKTAEIRRAELIGRVNLRLVGEGAGANPVSAAAGAAAERLPRLNNPAAIGEKPDEPRFGS
jgi:hypothetical protein